MAHLRLSSLLPVGLLLGLSLVAPACGDDDDDDNGAAGTAGNAGTSAGTSSAGGTGGSTAGTSGGGAAGTSSGAAGATAGSAGAAGGSSGTSGQGGSAGDAGAGGTTGGSAGTAGTTGGTAGTAGGAAGGTAGGGGSAGAPSMSFFVSSTTTKTANLGGLAGADKRCQDLATAVGAGGKTWRAYLSVEHGPTDAPIHARDRIGSGPWYNAKLALVASDLASLHERYGDVDVFLDEKGAKINGQWIGSPTPNEHDILTGTQRDGTVAAGKTCADWTSQDATKTAIVGHSDGLGPNQSTDAVYRPWNTSHENGSCADTAPKGGAGRIYCFAID